MQTPTTLSLTSAQIEHYRRDGYLVVSDLLTDEEIDRFVAYEAEPKPEGWRHSLRHHVDDDQWSRLARHPHVAGGAAQLLGGAPMIVQTMYLEKQPAGEADLGGQGVAFHQDLHYLPCQPQTLMACWVAMGDTDPENGGLCVVPGSHHDGLYGAHKNPNADEHDAWEIEYLMRDSLPLSHRAIMGRFLPWSVQKRLFAGTGFLSYAASRAAVRLQLSLQ